MRFAKWVVGRYNRPAIALQFATERNISLHDCQNTTRLQLDGFSPDEHTEPEFTGA